MRFNAYDNKATKLEAFVTLQDAWREAHRTLNGSALHCLEMARSFFCDAEKSGSAKNNNYGFAHEWATQSLAHSIGIFGDEYKTAMAMRASWGQPK